jgi:hypothetical protein
MEGIGQFLVAVAMVIYAIAALVRALASKKPKARPLPRSRPAALKKTSWSVTAH